MRIPTAFSVAPPLLRVDGNREDVSPAQKLNINLSYQYKVSILVLINHPGVIVLNTFNYWNK